MAALGGGDLLVVQKEHGQNPFWVDVDVATGDSATKSAVVAARTNFTIYIQKITISVITDAAQSLIFQDNGTPLIIAKTKASPGLGPIVYDWGPHGTALTANKQFDIAISGAGLAARVHIEGYMRQSGNIVIGAGPQNGNQTDGSTASSAL